MMRVLGFIHERALNLVHVLKVAFCSLLYANTGLTAETLLHCLGGPWRYFTHLDGGYYTIPEITLAGDFEIEFDVYATGSNFGRVLSGSGPSTINYEGNNFIGFRSTGNSFAASGATITRNQLTHVTVTRSGSDVSITSSNGTSGLLTGKSGDFVVEQITGNASGVGSDGYIDGIPANVHIKDNGTLILDYPLDEDFSQTSVVVNKAAVLGSELWDGTSPPSSIGSSWEDAGGNVYVATDATSGSDGNLVLAENALTLGEVYLVKYTLALSSGSVRFGFSAQGQPFESSGTYEKALVAADDRIVFDTGDGTNGTISSISLRQADGYGTYIPHANDETLPYVELEEGIHTTPWWPNLVAWSNDFTKAEWLKVRATVAGNVLTSTDPAETGLEQGVEFLEGSDITLSCRAKAGSLPYVHLLAWDAVGSGARAWFNLTTGAIGGTLTFGSDWAVLTYDVIDEGDGWYRCYATFSTTGASGNVRVSPSNGNQQTTSIVGGTILVEDYQANEGTVQDYVRTEDKVGRRIQEA